MSKIDLSTVSSGFQSTDALNQNFTDIEAEFQSSVLYRDNPDGEPNQMHNDLDMNGYKLLNVGNLAYVQATGVQTLSGYSSLKVALDTDRRITVFSTTQDITLTASDTPYVLPKLHLIDAEATLNLHLVAGTHTITSGNIANVGNNGNIRLVGATPVTTTLNGVDTVTGSAGAWQVFLRLASAAGISAGDVLLVKDVGPGGVITGVSTWPKYQNDLIFGHTMLGSPEVKSLTQAQADATSLSNSVSITAHATRVSFTKVSSAASLTAFLAVSDLIHIQGQTRQVASIESGGTCLVSVPFVNSVDDADFDYWYYSKPNTGTISIASGAGGTVSGVGTLFLSEANVGDFLVFRGELRGITSIVSNTACIINCGSATVSLSAAPFSVYTVGSQHEGAWVVQTVSGSSVAILNTSWSSHPPPKNLVSAGAITAIKTVLRQTGSGGGIIFKQGGALGEVDQLVVRGDKSSTTSFGVGLNGTTLTEQVASICTFASDTGIIDFGYNVHALTGSMFFGDGMCISGALSRGVYIEDGAQAYLPSAVISGNTGFGIFVGPGSYARLSSAVVTNNGSTGVRAEVGGAVYADFPQVNYNDSHGANLLEAGGSHFVGARVLGNTSDGYNFANGAGGRITGSMVGGNKSDGIDCTAALVEGTQVWCTGNAATGCKTTGADGTFSTATFTGNGAIGVRAITAGDAIYKAAFVANNSSYGVRAEQSAVISMTDAYLSNNDTYDCAAQEGGILDVQGYKNSAMLSLPALNKHTSAGLVKAEISTSINTTRQTAIFSKTVSLADDTAVEYTLTTNVAATLMLHAVTNGQTAVWGFVRLDLGSGTAYCTNLTSGASLTATTGALLSDAIGGTDGMYNVSVHTNGILYLKNRCGAARNVTFTLLGEVS